VIQTPFPPQNVPPPSPLPPSPPHWHSFYIIFLSSPNPTYQTGPHLLPVGHSLACDTMGPSTDSSTKEVYQTPPWRGNWKPINLPPHLLPPPDFSPSSLSHYLQTKFFFPPTSVAQGFFPPPNHHQDACMSAAVPHTFFLPFFFDELIHPVVFPPRRRRRSF